MFDIISGLYGPGYVSTIVYMLQSSEYHAVPYLAWFWRTNNFKRVSRRRSLDKTPIAKLLGLFLITGILLQVLVGLSFIWLGAKDKLTGGVPFGLALVLSYPIVWAHLVVLPTVLGRVLFINRRDQKLSDQTRKILEEHKAIVIAVAGSYGKTSMKEMLLTVLGAGKKVAATPANKNVITEHAKFARNLNKDEDVIVVEYGEEKPGDILKFAKISQPNIGIITGLAPTHLDKYKTLEAAGRDIFSLAEYLNNKDIFVNGDSLAVKKYLKPEFNMYSQSGINKHKVSNIKVSLEGTKFKLATDKATYQLHSGLVGRHHIGPVAAAVVIAEEIGLSKAQIIKGVGQTKPYEHRMEPKLIGGAWVLDDTYNGTIEGMKAGLKLLKELEAKRKIYITPGLVDQGKQVKKVHVLLGEYIAESNPDMVVLMNNSATQYIKMGLEAGKYKGQLTVQDNPLEFYTNLDKVVARGDVVMMQNDWTDNYN